MASTVRHAIVGTVVSSTSASQTADEFRFKYIHEKKREVQDDHVHVNVNSRLLIHLA